MAAALDIRDLSVGYPGADREALRDVTLELDAGGFVSVAGRNGAGKSTLSLAATGLVPRVIRADARGWVTVGGTVTTAAGRAGDPVVAGLVLGDPAFGLSGARASVREEIAFGLENLGVARDAMDGRIDRALAALAIEHLAERAPEALSGGEQQRVAIASALAMDAPLLVLDEASSGLDPTTTLALAKLLPTLAASGTAILAADHGPAVLLAAARTLVLEDGLVIATDAPERALAHPALQPGRPPSVEWAAVDAARPPSIELRGVTYRYDSGVEALRDVSVTVAPGETVAIVGENGSGKSTLAKHLVGLLRPTAGSVLLDGRDLAGTRIEDAARTVGFLFQDPRDQLFGRTVEGAVAFGPHNLGSPQGRAEAAVREALAATGVQDRRTANPHDLDLAARKQVALASVLAMQPGALILDEPTTGQDASGRARIGATIDALRATGRTILAITHDLGFAARFDRLLEMRGGEIVHEGPPGRVAAGY